MTLGERIRNRRIELGLSQQELAERLGYKSKVSVSNAENDRDDMTTTRIEKYAKALNTTPADLMGWLDVEIDTNFDTRIKDMENRMKKYVEIYKYLDSLSDKDIKSVEKYAQFLALQERSTNDDRLSNN